MAFWRKIPAASDVGRAPFDHPSPSSAPSQFDSTQHRFPSQAEARSSVTRLPSLHGAAEAIIQRGRGQDGTFAELRAKGEPPMAHVVQEVMSREKKGSRLGALLGRKKSKAALKEVEPSSGRAGELVAERQDGPSTAATTLERAPSARSPLPSPPALSSFPRRSTFVFAPTNPDVDEDSSDGSSSATEECFATGAAHLTVTAYERRPDPDSLRFDSLAVSHSPSRTSNEPAGLRNLGNTCYMACALQCLAASPALAAFFKSGDYKAEINRESGRGSRGALSKATASLLRAMYRAAGHVVDPISFYNTFVHSKPDFDTTDQQDAQEFLDFLLDALHEDLNLAGTASVPLSLSREEEARREKLPEAVGAELAWQDHLETNDSLILDLFQGMFRNKLRCLTCETTSTNFNPFRVLQLPIPLPSGRQVEVELADCFNAFLEAEVMQGEEAWTCSRCRRPRATKKWLSISRLPESTLIIQLKRFAYSEASEKIDTPVAFPLDDLDLGTLLPKQVHGKRDRAVIFHLYGIVNHHSAAREELESGHYTAMVKKDERWYEVDDEVVETIDEEIVAEASQSAYLLFYARQDPVE